MNDIHFVSVHPVHLVSAIVPLLMVAVLGITVHIKWVEVSLLYRIYVMRIGSRKRENFTHAHTLAALVTSAKWHVFMLPLACHLLYGY